MKGIRSLILYCSILLAYSTCQAVGHAKTNQNPTSPQEQCPMLSITTINVDHDCGAYQGYRSGFYAVVDFPMGKTTVESAIKAWINNRLNPWKETPYTGDLNDATAMLQHYSANCKKVNGSPQIEAELRAQNDGQEPQYNNDSTNTWFRMFFIKKEFENDHIVSYSAGWCAYDVGNATSSANCTDCTFDKHTGQQLSWEMFKKKKAVQKLIRQALIEKFGDDANPTGEGVPMPQAPLFLKDGVRFDYGNYTVGEAHYYESHEEFPSCFIPYKKLLPLLTLKASKLLKL